MKKNFLSWFSFILALAPTFLLFIAGLKTYLPNARLEGIFSSISHWSLLVRVIFFNTVFFLFPALAIIGSLLIFKRSTFLSILSIVLGSLVILWYGVHLALD